MSQWLNEQDDREKQVKLCNRLAAYLEALLEEVGYAVSTPLLEGAERALYEWKNS